MNKHFNKKTFAAVAIALTTATTLLVGVSSANSGTTTTSTNSVAASTSSTTVASDKVGRPAPRPHLQGVITNINGTTWTLQLTDKTQQVTVASTVPIDQGPFASSSTSPSVKTGDTVSVEGSLNSSGSFIVSRVHIVLPHADGVVTAKSSDTLTLQDKDGKLVSVKVTSSTKYAGDFSAGLSAIAVGTHIHAEGTLSGTTLTATGINSPHAKRGPGGKGHQPGMGGKITSVSGTSVVIQTPDGKNLTVNYNSSTKIHQGPNSLAASNLVVGKEIRVHTSAPTSSTASSSSSSTNTSVSALDIDIMLPHYEGVISSISGNNLTLTTSSGTNQVTYNSSTKIDFGRKGPASSTTTSSTTPSLAVGMRVHAEGVLSGTVLAASHIHAETQTSTSTSTSTSK